MFSYLQIDLPVLFEQAEIKVNNFKNSIVLPL
jgi:hypothetical protein